MHCIGTSTSLAAFFIVLLSVNAAQSGPAPETTRWGQTLCINGDGNGTDWDWELRPQGGGTPLCSGTGNVTGDRDDLVAATVAAIDGCAPGIVAEVGALLGTCDGDESGLTIVRGPNSENWELAIEDNTNPPNLKVPTDTDPVFFNARCRPPPQTPIPFPCNFIPNPPPICVPEPGAFASLLCGGFFLFGLDRMRQRPIRG